MAIVTKRTLMTLYSDSKDAYSHQVRIALAEKGVNVEIHQLRQQEKPQALLEANPYGSVPTLVDRDLVLYEARIIMEYLDERFPHPPLLPVYPVARAESRKLMYRIEQDWYELMREIERQNGAKGDKARKHLLESLVSIDAVFNDKPYFLSEEFSLVDCALAPLLWRLPQLGIEIPKQAKGLIKYMDRLFDRDAFQASLTDIERELRAA